MMTATTPAIDEDVDTILQDAAPDPACMVDQCEARADGMIILDCGADFLFCAPHYAVLVEEVGNGRVLKHSMREHPEHEATIARWVAL